MLICMRTTLNLPDALAAEAKARAAAEGRTFTDLVVAGLRLVLDVAPASARPAPLPTFGDRTDPRDRFLVDLLDRDALWDALDADGAR
jgi:hypothetical protein